MPVEDLTYRNSDLALRQDAGGDVVQQRLEQVVVAPIEQGHIDRFSAKEAAGRQPTKASAHDDHAMSGGLNRGHLSDSSGSDAWRASSDRDDSGDRDGATVAAGSGI
jgi:hypothetical protein